MNIRNLNNSILMEVELIKLHKEYENAKKELKDDIDYKIAMDKLKKFLIKHMNFVKKFDISKTRITVIEKTAKSVIEFVEDKIEDLKRVSQIPDDELKPLQDFLDEFKDTVKNHTEKQAYKYKNITTKV